MRCSSGQLLGSSARSLDAWAWHAGRRRNHPWPAQARKKKRWSTREKKWWPAGSKDRRAAPWSNAAAKHSLPSPLHARPRFVRRRCHCTARITGGRGFFLVLTGLSSLNSLPEPAGREEALRDSGGVLRPPGAAAGSTAQRVAEPPRVPGERREDIKNTPSPSLIWVCSSE